MALNISAASIRKPIPATVLFLVLMILGFVSFAGLPITRFPNIDFPLVSVTVTQSGAAPAELETQVTKKVEDAVAGVSGVKKVNSAVTDGSSVTTIEFRLEVNSDRALNDVKDAIARIRADLPRTIDEPITQRIDIAGLPIVTYAAAAPALSAEELSWFVDDVVARELQGVKGVSKVERVGGVNREIRVTLDPDRLLAFGVTAAEVNRQVRSTNVNLAGGRGEIGGQEQTIRTLAGAKTVEDLKATSIALPGGRKVRLDELGKVDDTAEEPRQFARFNGEPVVAFSISRSRGASDADVAKLVEAKVQQIQARRPEVRLQLIDTYVTYTVGNYESAMHTLLEGAALAVIVVFIFLKDWRATLIAAIALPLSAIPTFWAMSMMGFSLNVVSLLALTLVTGILVDDAIVEIENIVRHMRMGKSAYRASIDAADEIGLAVIAISFTIVAVFAPVSFMGGIAGQYFKQFGLTVAIAVLFSLLAARLVTPVLTAYFMRSAGHDHGDKEGFVMRAYTRLVGWSARHRFLTLVIGLGLFAGSLYSTQLLPSGFLPEEDTNRSLFVAELAPGARLDDTRAATDQIVARLRERPEVESVYVTGGRLPMGPTEVRKATFVVNLVPKEARQKTQSQLENDVLTEDLAQVPDIRYWRLNENGQRQMSLIVAGDDQAAVAEVATKLVSEMRTIPTLQGPVTTAALDRPEVRIIPRNRQAADLGVSTDVIAETVRVATIGDIGPNLAKFDIGTRQIPIRVQIDERLRGDTGLLEALRLPSGRGPSVPVAAVAEVALGQGPAAIDRENRVRRIAVEADLFGTDALGAEIEKVMQLPTARNLPPGVQIVQSGDAEVMGEVFQGFAFAMGAGLMMVYGVLVLLFGGFLQPITILFSLPLSFGGVVAALLITQKAISMPVVIGMLMLMGIVTKNAIMLIDFAVEEVARGVNRVDAIVDAGRKRARPIIMTTLAMGAGMVPSALALGAGGEFRAPMAIAVIGGLIVSTLLSLVFVPAVFLVMDDVGRFFAWAFGRFVGAVDEPEEDGPGHRTGAVLGDVPGTLRDLPRREPRLLPEAAE
ncbi:MAG TPA: efflux RND transporter permease subunit [Beijerinckiaceae bacterium]|jgi:hydrophobe/amphiphile efflux-1 (HAE1) family protein